MKREDITRLFEGATEEQIKALLDANSADITHALNKQKGDLTTAQTQLEEAQKALKDLRDATGDVEGLRTKIREYEDAETARKAAAAKAEKEAELNERFTAVSGDREYIHDYVRRGVMEEFGRALEDKTWRGKSDAEIFDTLTKDKNYFKSQNPPDENMGGMNSDVNESDNDKLSDAEYYAKVFAKK